MDARQGLPQSAAVGAGGPVEEDALAHFVPADSGDAAYDAILRDFGRTLPLLEKKLGRRGIPGVFWTSSRT